MFLLERRLGLSKQPWNLGDGYEVYFLYWLVFMHFDFCLLRSNVEILNMLTIWDHKIVATFNAFRNSRMRGYTD